MSAIKPPQPVSAPADVMALARDNCAQRLRERGYPTEAEAFERGERDFAWGFRHEVAKLLSEARPA